MKHPFYSRSSFYDIIIALGVFATLLSIFLFSYIPAIWHHDAFNFINVAQQWSVTGEYQAAHWPDYPGWVFVLRSIFNSTLDVFSLIWRAQLVTFIFASLAAATFYLIARMVSHSRIFGLAMSAVFAANPVIWSLSSTPMSDIPALFFILVSLLLFIHFYRTRSLFYLVGAAIILSLASLFRLTSLFMLIVYLAGLAYIYFDREKLTLSSRIKPFLRDAFTVIIFTITLSFIVYGPLWEIASRGPALSSSLGDILSTLRIYLARDVGWFWVLFMFLGFIFGFKRKHSRPLAFILAISIGFLLVYIAGWHKISPGDTERYLIAIIPLGLLAISFLWEEAILRFNSRSIPTMLLGVFTLWYLSLSLWGIFTSDASAILKKPNVTKLLFLPAYQLSNTTHTRQIAARQTQEDALLLASIPPNSIILNNSSNWSSLKFFYGVGPNTNPLILSVTTSVQMEQKIEEIKEEFENVSQIFIHRSLENIDLESALKKRGFIFKRTWAGSELFERPQL